MDTFDAESLNLNDVSNEEEMVGAHLGSLD